MSGFLVSGHRSFSFLALLIVFDSRRGLHRRESPVGSMILSAAIGSFGRCNG